MKRLRNASFLALIILIVVLIITTLSDHITGDPGNADAVYGSLPFVLLWGTVTLLATAYILRQQLWKIPVTFLIHVSFLVILCGALTTYIWGEQGSMILEKDLPCNAFILKNGEITRLPFSIKLDQFEVACYPGTSSPQDYISKVSIEDGGYTSEKIISMNKILSYKNYRFYQAGYDRTMMATRLSVSHDPYGIAITYTGYGLLLLSMILFFFQPNSLFRTILKQKLVLMAILLSIGTIPTRAKNMPRIAPTEVAEELGNLYMFHNGRICPVESFAIDFTRKLYGKSTYRQRTANEVLAGWVFFPDTWKPEPMIKEKDGEVKRILGTEESYVSLLDFANELGEYKLREALSDGSSAVLNANEKINIINSVFSGAALRIFPIKSADGLIDWYASSDELPQDMDMNKWTFVRKSLDLVAEKLAVRKYDEAKELIKKIKEYQIKECGNTLPSDEEFQAERTYNRISSAKPWAIASVTLGFLAFLYFVYCTTRLQKPSKCIVGGLNTAQIAILAYLTYCMYLRTSISHHLPLSNGYETMQALAWSCLLLTLFMQKKFSLALAFGLLVSGMALLVSMMGQSNPAITNLMPVLHSPLLSIHVMVIMIAYALMAFIMLNGITALFFMHRKMETEVLRITRVSQLMLYPALFLLTAGIFIGAVWANQSWGRYWGWDPKEVWALITMLIYAIPLHRTSVPFVRSAKWFHLYMILAFLSVLFTYFGVNFLLGGMHSYAA